jgi:coenzyme F420-reducing hydrogenase delta subunit
VPSQTTTTALQQGHDFTDLGQIKHDTHPHHHHQQQQQQQSETQQNTLSHLALETERVSILTKKQQQQQQAPSSEESPEGATKGSEV